MEVKGHALSWAVLSCSASLESAASTGKERIKPNSDTFANPALPSLSPHGGALPSPRVAKCSGPH